MLKSRSNMFLVDGFPRALDQAETFERDILPCQTVRALFSYFCNYAIRQHSIRDLADSPVGNDADNVPLCRPFSVLFNRKH